MSVYPRKVPNNKKRIFLFRNNRAFPFHLIRRWNYVLSRLIKYSIFKNNRFFMFGHFILSVIIARESTRNSTEPIQTAKPRCLQNSPLQSVYLYSKQRVSDNRFLCNQGNVEHLASNNHHTHCDALYPISQFQKQRPALIISMLNPLF